MGDLRIELPPTVGCPHRGKRARPAQVSGAGRNRTHEDDDARDAKLAEIATQVEAGTLTIRYVAPEPRRELNRWAGDFGRCMPEMPGR